MAVLNLIWKSLTRQRGLYILWIASAALAVAGLIVVDVYRGSMDQMLRVQGRQILTADAVLSVRRTIREEEVRTWRGLFPKGTRFTSTTEMLGMVTGGGQSRLAQLNFIEDEYPLVGRLQIEGSRGNSAPELWVTEDFLSRMGLKVGDTVRVGELGLTITGVVRKDSSQTLRFGAMAPRVYLNRKFLALSGLVQVGSTLSETLRALTSTVEGGLKKRLEKSFPDPSIQITTPEDMQQGSLRVMGRLLDFLGLVGLVGLSLGWIGVYFLSRRWLQIEYPVAGIFKAHGFSSRQLALYLRLKLLIILTLGVLTGGALAWWACHAVMPAARDVLPDEFRLTWSWSNSLILLLTGPGAGLLLLHRPIQNVLRQNPLDLVRGRIETVWSWSALILPCVGISAIYLGLTFLEARSWYITLIFLGGLISAVLLLSGISYSFLWLAARPFWTWKGWLGSLATSQWRRRAAITVLMIVVSGLAGLLAQLIPNLEKTLLLDLMTPKTGDRPALFLIDIQRDQVASLEAFVTEQGSPVSEKVPMIRSRILKVNDREFERSNTTQWATREEEAEARFRNRGVNLTYRTHPGKNEKIVSGKTWDQMVTSGPVLDISVEDGYAERLGLKVGDRLQFDVDSVTIDAQIANLRHVEWNDFEPGFFIVFAGDALAEAPQTWIMTVKEQSGKTPAQLQNLISAKFSNVTAFNVAETIGILADLFFKLSAGLKVAGALSLGLGLFVFLIVLVFQLASSERDWIQLRVLGLKQRQVLGLQLLTYGGLSVLGTALGAVLSIAMTWALAHFAFSSSAAMNPLGIVATFAFTVGLIAVAIVIFNWRSPKRLSLKT